MQEKKSQKLALSNALGQMKRFYIRMIRYGLTFTYTNTFCFF